MDIGELVWIVGRPKDGWVRSLGIVIGRRVSGYLLVSPMHNPTFVYKLCYSEIEPFHKK